LLPAGCASTAARPLYRLGAACGGRLLFDVFDVFEVFDVFDDDADEESPDDDADEESPDDDASKSIWSDALLNNKLVFAPTRLIAARQIAITNPSITAYSTAVGPSVDRMNRRVLRASELMVSLLTTLSRNDRRSIRL
jgi:hypothetical protein